MKFKTFNNFLSLFRFVTPHELPGSRSRSKTAQDMSGLSGFSARFERFERFGRFGRFFWIKLGSN